MKLESLLNKVALTTLERQGAPELISLFSSRSINKKAHAKKGKGKKNQLLVFPTMHDLPLHKTKSDSNPSFTFASEFPPQKPSDSLVRIWLPKLKTTFLSLLCFAVRNSQWELSAVTGLFTLSVS